MPSNYKIRKGLNIKLVGEAVKNVSTPSPAESYALKPSDFTGVIPKLLVREGDEVQAGTALFYDRANEAIKFCAPVSGEIIDIVRGEKRKVLEIRILADKEISYINFEKKLPEQLNRKEIVDHLLLSGIWPCIRQRPFGIIANPIDIPKSIFVSAFDTSPLAPDYNFIMQEQETDFQTGLMALKKLTDGKLHVNVHAALTTSDVLLNAKGVEINRFSGPHPSGNVGIQIHHIDPVNKGEVVWTINPQDVLLIGRLFNTGKYDAGKMIAITGSNVNNPAYFKCISGSSVNNMLSHAGLKPGKNRVISGNVLTGVSIPENGYIGFYDSQVTVIPEGDEPEFMGWLAPGFKKLSTSRTFFSWLTPGKKYAPDTNLHGEERPFVMTGEYERVLPMDIYPVHLLKSILVEDIEEMENLGIYEVVEEDFALCEFVCTSKIESQEIIRRGLEIVRKEVG